MTLPTTLKQAFLLPDPVYMCVRVCTHTHIYTHTHTHTSLVPTALRSSVWGPVSSLAPLSFGLRDPRGHFCSCCSADDSFFGLRALCP